MHNQFPSGRQCHQSLLQSHSLFSHPPAGTVVWEFWFALNIFCSEEMDRARFWLMMHLPTPRLSLTMTNQACISAEGAF